MASGWGEQIETPLDWARPRNELNGRSLADLKALTLADVAALARHTPPPYPVTDRLSVVSPRDQGAHIAELWVACQVTHSWELNMYGFVDPLVAALTRYWCEQPQVLVVGNLDRTQASGRSERQLLDLFLHDQVGNSIAVGTSTVGGAISHLKWTVADKRIRTTGSMNMSEGGEEKQDNELLIVVDPLEAGEASTVIGLNHDAMLQQMAKRAAASAPAATT